MFFYAYLYYTCESVYLAYVYYPLFPITVHANVQTTPCVCCTIIPSSERVCYAAVGAWLAMEISACISLYLAIYYTNTNACVYCRWLK